MAEQSLATKWRPKNFNEVVGQKVIKQILNEQLKTNNVKRVLLFTGPAGCGKTTNARIFAKELEPCVANIMEINCADHNGVDDFRELIIKASKTKPLSGHLKVFVMDEVHMATMQAQNALLKLLEEPPAHCVFILCTTDPQKILGTILSRAYRYDFQKISIPDIYHRLEYIIQAEKNSGAHINSWEPEALSYIAKICNGHMRDAIVLLDKCLTFSPDLTLNQVISVLGTISYDLHFSILDALLNKNQQQLLTKLEEIYLDGKDLKLFVKDFLSFILDISKYSFTKSFEGINIPNSYEYKLNEFITQKTFIKHLLNVILDLNSNIKWETSPKTLMESVFLLEVM